MSYIVRNASGSLAALSIISHLYKIEFVVFCNIIMYASYKENKVV